LFGRADIDIGETNVVMGKDGKGPLTFKCTKGHDNTREDGKPFLKNCKHCNERVSCEPEPENTEKDKVIWLFKRQTKNEPRPKVKI
jgi:hypothetical protein